MSLKKFVHELPDVITSHPNAKAEVQLQIRHMVMESFALQEKVTCLINGIRITVCPESLSEDGHEHSMGKFFHDYEKQKERHGKSIPEDALN